MPQNPRTETTQKAYEEFRKSADSAIKNQQFNFANEVIVAEYKHWFIIKNRFPYDTMVRVNDMLVSKRPVGNFSELSSEEHVEYHEILERIAQSGNYDARIENFPKVQTVKRHIHIHLICWHNTQS